ncbi:MAG: flagellar hook-associated protein FlgK [Planctomycetota bacterium]
MSFGFYTGLRGMNAARLGMELVGHNIANLNTPGFSRQQALQSSAFPMQLLGGFQIGTGADISTVRRIVDERLDARIRTQNGLFGKALVDNRRMSEIEGVLAEPGDDGMSGLLNSFFGSIGKLRSDAGSRALRGAAIQDARSVTDGFNLLAQRYTSLREDSFPEVEGEVENANLEIQHIADLNAQIISLEANGHQANDLRDEREASIKRLSELVDVRVVTKTNGSADVMAAGHLVVSSGRGAKLVAARGKDGSTEVRVGDTGSALDVRQGRLAGLLHAEGGVLPDLLERLDGLARSLILETNRVHTTGVPRNGPMTSLVSDNHAIDGDDDGRYDDELLEAAGFPFDVKGGDLWVAVSDLDTGDVTRTRLAIDPRSMTLGDLATAISDIDHLDAHVDPSGRLRIKAETGWGFDFSGRLDPSPASKGTFGGASASLGGGVGGPFDLSTPMAFQVAVDGGAATTITLSPTDFRSSPEVPADELAKVLTGKFKAASLGLEAVAVGNHLSLVATSTGTASSLAATDGAGSPLAALGIPTGVTASGRASGLEVEVQGSYTGKGNGHLRFVAESSGTVGVDPQVLVGVYREDGTKLTTIDVGRGHDPLDAIDLGDGIQVFIKHGSISQADGDQFAVDTLADSDTSDVLVALGLNGFFSGSGAADIAVSERLLADPDALSAGLVGTQGDAGNLARLAALRERTLEGLGGHTLESFYDGVAADVGFETRKSEDLLQSEATLMGFLENERESISGVNLDEEMVELVKYQQAFQASARFISQMSEMTDVLINLGR